MKKLILISVFILSFCFLINAWEDEVLFTGGTYSILKPNVLIMMDNSGSMNSIIFHPDYNNSITYSGTSSWIYLDDVEGTQTVSINGHNVELYKYKEGTGVRYSPNYLNWIGWHATPTQRDEVSHFSQYGTFDTSDFTDYEDTRTRIQVARRVMTEVVYDIHEDYENDPDPNKAYPRLGLSLFDSDNTGSDQVHPCQQESNPTSFANIIKSIIAQTWTPLSEAYAEQWAYFRTGGTPKLDGPGSTYFLPFSDSSAGTISSSPITNWCQMNFIIVVTDGESTQDIYLRNHPTNSLFYTGYHDGTSWVHDNSAPWGDTSATENDDDTATLDSYGSNYLDDLAYFAFNNDLYPDDIDMIKNDNDFDEIYKNKQFIFTYAVGFTIDNQLLSDTAENGGGEYFVAKDYDSLLQAMKDVFASIDEKVRSYASFAAPKFSLTYSERRGYAATFVPKNNQTLWEGHLKCYLLDENGDFPTDLENPGSALLWDAGPVLNARTSERDINTIIGSSWVDFTTGNISPADLGFASGDTTQDETDRDEVVNFIRGDNGYNWKLGDIFHFNPLVVGVPLPWKGAFDTSYQDFFQYYTKTGAHSSDGVVRTEVVYVGANDGMFHCFKVETGEELWAFIPPSLLTKLKHMVPDVTGSLEQHQYFIDGKAIVKDIKVGTSGDWTDWKTVLIFGMGIGGNAYCALDVTDPTSPVFLWEFIDSTMGLTEAKPIIAELANDGSGSHFPAVFLSGGYNQDELPAPGDLEGKSFFILDAYTGVLIKKFIYGASTSDPDTLVGGSYIHTNSGFKYAFTSTPSIIDQNYDGYADYAYWMESGDYRGTNGQGGRIWKINLDGAPVSWRPSLIFQADDGQTLFLPPTLGFDQNFNLWLLFGTGHRAKPNHSDNLTGQFIGLIDSGNISTALDTGDLSDITASFSNPGTDSEVSLSSYQGFYFSYVNETSEILFEPNPLFLNFQVYFNTYAPTGSGVVDDPCACEGNQWVYSFTLTGMGSMVNISDTNVFSGKIQGYGALSGGKFKIYIGEGVAGSPNIQTQLTVDLSDIFGPIYWKEDRD
jgi:type IV pilus assembly protein PilY1